MDDHQPSKGRPADTLRLHHGSPLSRRQLRRQLRERRHRDEHDPTQAHMGLLMQVPYYIPPSDRASLSTISDSTLRFNKRHAYWIQKETSTKPLRTDMHPTRPSVTSCLLELPLELRQQIYGYLFPWNEQHLFQTSVHGKIPNFAVKAAERASYSIYSGPTHERLQAHTAIMRVNSQLHQDAREYLFHDCIIRIQVDESGYSFLETDPGGPFPDVRRGPIGIQCAPSDYDFLNYKCRDRFTGWHKSFMSNFDFTQPKKLMITIQAPDYENPEGVVQIRESMMDLCNVLCKCCEIKAIEVEPQSQGYLHTEQAHRRTGRNDTRSSYFVWEWENKVLPASQAWFEHKLRTNRHRFNREAVWRGKLSRILSQEWLDLQLVLQPLYTLRNVGEATIVLPPSAEDITWLQDRIRGICICMSGPKPGVSLRPVSKHLELYGQNTKKCMFTSLLSPLSWE